MESCCAILAGVALGDLTAMMASMLGMGAILATSATVFTVLRRIGGAYLIYLGVKLWRVPVHVTEPVAAREGFSQFKKMHGRHANSLPDAGASAPARPQPIICMVNLENPIRR